MLEVDYFKLTLDIYATNHLQQILKYANISHDNTYYVIKTIPTIKRSLVDV